MRVSCVHESESTIAEFETAAPPGVALEHFVHPCAGTDEALVIERAAQTSDAVVVTAREPGAQTLPCAIPYAALLEEAMKDLTGDIDVIGAAETITPGLSAAVAAVGAKLLSVPEPPAHAALGIARLIARSDADHIVLLHAAGPVEDTRVQLAAALALTRLSQRSITR